MTDGSRQAPEEKPLVVTLYSDAIYFGGAEEYLVSIARGLDRSRFTLRAVLPPHPGAGRLQSALEEYGARVSHLEPPGFAWRSRRAEMVAAFRECPGDVLHINLPSTYDAGVSSIAWAAKEAGYPRVVSTEHLPMIDRKYKKFPIKWYFSRYVDRLMTAARSNRDYLVRLHGMNTKKIDIIPNGVEAPVAWSPEEASAFHQQWGRKDGEVIVGVVGRLTKRKGHHFLLDAAAPLLARGLKFRLVFVGDGEETETLQAQATRLGIADRVFFAGARSDGARMPFLFDLFVLASTVETMPLSILEAMACGCPVLSTTVYGIPEIVDNEETGVLIEPADVEALREELERLVCDPETRTAMGHAARRRYEEEFTAKKLAERTAAVYLGREASGLTRRSE